MEESETMETGNEATDFQVIANKGLSYWLNAALLLAFALRILLLDTQSIWWDEGISLHLAVSSLVELAVDRLNNIHPPLYYVLLKGWLNLLDVNVFVGRYLSVIASWLQVVVIYALARRWFSKRTGYAALLLATLSAVSIIYGQEIRVYAMLALIYLLLLAVTHKLTRREGAEAERSKWIWFSLGLLMWVGLHLHYIVFFVVAYVSAWALIIFIRQQRWVDFRRWLLVMYLVAMASLPWFIAVLQNWTAVSAEAAAGTFTSESVPLSFLISQVWVFQLTGLAGALARTGVARLAAVAAVILSILVLIRLGQKSTRRETAALLAHWLIPLSSALAVWTIRSFSHPRYVSMFAPGLILLVAYVTVPPHEHKGRRLLWIPNFLSVLLYLTVIASSLWGLWLYFVDPEVAKDDVRGVARYLEVEAEANDLILIPDTDWSLPFEYKGDVNIAMPGLNDAGRKWSNLTALTTGVDRVHLLDYPQGTRDWQGLLPFALGKAGALTSAREFKGLSVQSYDLDEAILEPQMQPEQLRFEPLLLTGSWTEQDGIAGDAMTVALRWLLTEPMGNNAHVSIRLVDDGGWSVAVADDLLVDEYGRPSSYWSEETPVVTYHVINLPPAVPPFAYDLELQTYVAHGSEIEPLNILDEQDAPKGQTAVISESHVAYEQEIQLRNQADLPLSPWPDPVRFAPGLTLLKGEVSTDAVYSGEDLNVRLLWQATADRMPDLHPEVALVQENVELDVSDLDPVYGKYPVSVWSNGEQVFERRNLSVPPDASGTAAIVLRVGGEELELGTLTITEFEHSFEQPAVDYPLGISFGDVAHLTGFSLPQTVFNAQDKIALTLVWQSLSNRPEQNSVVFTHLLDDQGRLIAQHDSPPANGARPISGWVLEEYVIDAHQLTFLDADYAGTAQIEVGLYDSLSGERLMLEDGTDHFILPIEITIEKLPDQRQ